MSRVSFLFWVEWAGVTHAIMGRIKKLGRPILLFVTVLLLYGRLAIYWSNVCVVCVPDSMQEYDVGELT